MKPKTENELKVTFDRLTFHIENSPLAFIEWDNLGYAKTWSKRAEEIFGWTAKEFIKGRKKGIHQVYIEDVPLVTRILSDLTSGAVQRNNVEHRIVTKEGKVIWCAWFNSIILNDFGKVVTIMSLVEDINERKKAEEQKEYVQKEKEALINTTDDLIWSVSRDYKLLAVNKAFNRILEEKTGVTFRSGDDLMRAESFSEEILVFWKEAYNRAFTGASFKIESFTPALLKSNGIWNETSFDPIYKDETVVAVACYSRDITERKLTEQRIRQSEAHLAEAQRLAKLGSWDYDIKNDKLTWSDELYNVFGTDKQLFLETHSSFLDLIDAEDRDFALQTSRHTQLTGESFNIEYKITTPKGERRVIRERGYGQTDDNGNVFRLFGTAQDITERKKTEEELQQMNEKLRSLSAHLQNIQENERTAIAREIHDELGQNLTALKMDIDWMSKRLPDDTILKEKVKDILSMVGDIFKTVKKIAVELRPNILDDLGLIAALEWQGQEFEKHTGIAFQFNCECLTFNPDRYLSTHLFRISQEALTNVARHSGATKIDITLEATDHFARLIIEDNGKGFDTGEVKDNNSLGLIGMNERALMLKGKLTIESKESKGTVITLVVPISEENKKEL